MTPVFSQTMSSSFTLTGVLQVSEDLGNCETDISIVTEGEKNKAVAKLGDQMARATTVVHTMLAKLYIFCDKIGDVTAKQALSVSFIEECTETRATGKVTILMPYMYRGSFKNVSTRSLEGISSGLLCIYGPLNMGGS
jgi:hypothetical protein